MPSNRTSIELSKVQYSQVPSRVPIINSFLSSIKHIEKKSFPVKEAFDFDSELTKKNTSLFCAYLPADAEIASPTLCGYLVYSRTKIITRIHKVCVVESMRNQGIGKFLLKSTLDNLQKGGAGKVDLWVDEKRSVARHLYLSCGFQEGELVPDYYGPGRTAIRMYILL